jgi:hypothetical protein
LPFAFYLLPSSMFTRSRRNLAYWFALSMGSILVLFAGVSYYLSVEGELQAFDQALYKKSKAITSGATIRLQGGQWQIEPEEAPWMGSDHLSRNSDLVYVRWYNAKGYLVRFIGLPAPIRLTAVPEFQTIAMTGSQKGDELSSQWLRQITLPLLQNQQLVGYLQVAEPLTPLRESSDRVRLYLALGVPVTLGVIGITGWFLGGIAMQPTQAGLRPASTLYSRCVPRATGTTGSRVEQCSSGINVTPRQRPAAPAVGKNCRDSQVNEYAD